VTHLKTNGDPVIHLVRSARRRLWWALVLRRLPAAAWLAGLSLLAIGGADLLPGVEPGVALATGSVFAASLAGFLPGLLTRPSLADAALHADRTFGTHALLVSALEAGGADGATPAARAVIERAGRAAQDLHAERARLGRRPPVAGAALALVPAFLGLLLLQLPSSAEDDSATVAQAAPAATTAFFAPGREDERSLRQLRETLTAGTDADPRADAGTRLPRSNAPTTRRPRPGSAREAVSDAGDRTPGFAAAIAGHGAEAGDAQAGVTAPMGDGDSGMTPGVTTALARDGRSVAAGAGVATDYAHAEVPGRQRQPVTPAAAPPGQGSWRMLNAAQTAFARRYLETAGKNDE